MSSTGHAWLISDVLKFNVHLIFSLVRCSVLAEIDSAVIATIVLNPGELQFYTKYIIRAAIYAIAKEAPKSMT